MPEIRLRRLLVVLALTALAASLAACALPRGEGAGPIVGAGGARLDEAALVAALAETDVVVLGEVHDNPVHHARQARLVRALDPGGIAFEMVPAASEEGVAVFLAQGGGRDEIGPAIGWERLGWPDWRLYAPVFAAAGEAYVAGGGPARSEIREALRRGAAAAWGAGADAVGLDRPLAGETRRALEDEMIAAHCDELPRLAARAMVEAQRFKDARLAEAALRARERGGGRAVLIAGNEHARSDRGAPEFVRRLAPGLTVRSVGMIELPAGADPADAAKTAAGLPYDYVWFSEPMDRGDPCARFR